MRYRCHNPKCVVYPDYGGRGIYVFEEWRHDFWAFIRHIGERPSKGHSIDRIDGNGSYVPGNVRWATATEQARNMKSNVIVDYEGDEVCVSELAEITGMSRDLLDNRIRSGWSVERAVSSPSRKSAPKRYLYEGEMLLVSEIARRSGIKHEKIRYQLRLGVSLDEILKRENAL